jgi:hypothetical protein
LLLLGLAVLFEPSQQTKCFGMVGTKTCALLPVQFVQRRAHVHMRHQTKGLRTGVGVVDNAYATMAGPLQELTA